MKKNWSCKHGYEPAELVGDTGPRRVDMKCVTLNFITHSEHPT